MSKHNHRLCIFLVLTLSLSAAPVFSQFLHHDWTQSYSVHETARVLEKGEFGLSFGVNNYFLAWSADSVAYDLLTFDIMIRYGMLSRIEFSLKYSYPAAALVGLKYGLVKKPVAIAAKFSLGCYTLTNQDYRTGRVIDFYPGIIFEKLVYKGVSVFAGPKLIYSWHIADRSSDLRGNSRKSGRCNQYGYSWGIAWGNKKTSFTVENNWLWSTYERVTYKIHQIGFGITRFWE